MKLDTINIAITAIKKWRHRVIDVEGDNSMNFDFDTTEAIKELEKELML